MLFFAGGCKKRTDVKNAIIKNDWLASKERLSDPEYISLLAKMYSGELGAQKKKENIVLSEDISGYANDQDPDEEARIKLLEKMKSQSVDNALKNKRGARKI